MVTNGYHISDHKIYNNVVYSTQQLKPRRSRADLKLKLQKLTACNEHKTLKKQ